MTPTARTAHARRQIADRVALAVAVRKAEQETTQ